MGAPVTSRSSVPHVVVDGDCFIVHVSGAWFRFHGGPGDFGPNDQIAFAFNTLGGLSLLLMRGQGPRGEHVDPVSVPTRLANILRHVVEQHQKEGEA